jgi:hypothetical protein
MSAMTMPVGQNQASEIQVDLHGYHPDDIAGWPLEKIIEQAWQIGADKLRIIHGHGRNRVTAIRGVNTNTGFFGLRIRNELRYASDEIRRYIKITTLDCAHEGSTSIKLKKNPRPTRTGLDLTVLPESSVRYRRGWY